MSLVHQFSGGDLQRIRRTIDELRDQIAPEATDSEFAYFAEVCIRLELSPVGEQVYLVGPRYDKRLKRNVHKVHIGVAGRRVLAERTGKLRGVVGPMWCGPRSEPGAPLVWEEVWTGDGFPYAARVLTYRIDRDPNMPANGTCKWSSFAQTDNQGALMPTWKQMPDHMLGKDAESLSLKRAFPEVIPNDLDITDADDDPALWVPPAEAAPAVAPAIARGPDPAPDELRNELADRLAAITRQRPSATDELRRRWVQLFAPEPAPVVRTGPYTVNQALDLDDWLREVEDHQVDEEPPPDVYDDDPEAFEAGSTRYDPDDAA